MSVVSSLVQLYNSVLSDSGIKSYAFEKLIELCKDNDCSEIVIERARQVVQTSKDWKLSDEERKSLYKTIGGILDQLGDSTYAFKVMHAYLRLFKASDAKGMEEAQTEARRCVILAIKALDVINFAELLDLPVIKKLQDKNEKVFKLLNLLSQSSAKEFAGKMKEFKDLMATENVTDKELITKKSYV